jgi:hypothetical protein
VIIQSNEAGPPAAADEAGSNAFWVGVTPVVTGAIVLQATNRNTRLTHIRILFLVLILSPIPRRGVTLSDEDTTDFPEPGSNLPIAYDLSF